jgi:hypothetical protein
MLLTTPRHVRAVLLDAIVADVVVERKSAIKILPTTMPVNCKKTSLVLRLFSFGHLEIPKALQKPFVC